MTSKLTTGEGGSSDDVPRLRAHYQDEWENYSGRVYGVSEIVEEDDEYTGQVLNMKDEVMTPPLHSIPEEVEESVFSFDFRRSGDDAVYVAVGTQNEEVCMDALIWAINNAVVPSSTVVFLIHVFPETKFIPSPLGKLPISQVNPEQKNHYLAQERIKRREFLQKFLSICSAAQVKVDTILIESDMEAKAILDLIPILNITKLVLGTTKSNIRRLRTRRSNGITGQILQNAPDFCEVKIICQGKELAELALESPSYSSSTSSALSSPTSPSHSPSPRAPKLISPSPSARVAQVQPGTNDATACGCFKI